MLGLSPAPIGSMGSIGGVAPSYIFVLHLPRRWGQPLPQWRRAVDAAAVLFLLTRKMHTVMEAAEESAIRALRVVSG